MKYDQAYYFNLLFNELKAFINKRSTWLFLAIILFGFLFRQIIYRAYDEIIISKILVHIDSNPKNQLILFIAISILMGFYCYWYIINSRKHSTLFFLYSCTVTYIYCHFRNNPHYDFYGFEFQCCSIYYLDSLTFFFLLISVSYITGFISKFQQPHFFTDPFEIDTPIENGSKDRYGRKPFALKIAEKIMCDYDHKTSLAIGINGPWGSGKTSFINMIKHEIESETNIESRVLIDFYPWKSTSPQQIISDFFDVFTSEIKKFSPKLSNKILSYSKTLTSIDENFFTKAIDKATDTVLESETKQDLYNEINEALENTNRQIIVFVDDIDRLDKYEVIEVIRLIRNTASFHHVVFVVTYDREYLVNSIKHLNDLNPHSYLEKIFQFEFVLPSYEKSILKQMFSELVKSKISQSHESDLQAFLYPVINEQPLARHDFFNEYLKTKRDVVRFVNVFIFDYSFIHEEIDVVQLAHINLLKIKYPDIYDLLFDMKDKFFETEVGPMGLDYFLHLKDTSPPKVNKKANTAEENKTYPFVLEEYMKNCHPIQYKQCDLNLILDILDYLFPININKFYRTTNPYSISNDKNFYKYFSSRVFIGEIPFSEFNNVIKLPLDEYKKAINKWLDADLLDEVKTKLGLLMVSNFSNRADFEKHLKILFHFGEKTARPEGGYFVDARHLYNFMYQEETSGVVKNWYNNDFNEYKKFINSIFIDAEYPYRFPSWFISVINYSYVGSFVIEAENLIQYNLRYFKEYFDKNRNLGRPLWPYYYNNKLRETFNKQGDTSQVRDKTNIEANKILLDGILEYNLIDEFLSSLLVWDHRNDKGYMISHQVIQNIFVNSEEFEKYLKYLNDSHPSKAVTEYIEFYFKSKEKSFQLTPFTFKYLSPQKV